MASEYDQTDLAQDYSKGVIVDLHCHSSYAGGTGSLNLQTAVENMPKKGVQLVGTGDCLFPPWIKTLKEQLQDSDESGVFTLKNATEAEKKTKFVLQTELVLTAPVGVHRKQVHCVFLFPSFEAIEGALKLLDKFKVKNSMGRPFITNSNAEEVSEKLNEILDLDPLVEIFPAHVLVPLGIFGPAPSITYLEDFFGEVSERFNAFETGLSADPTVTTLIPELDRLTLLSNSDAHSAALNRLGRELTCLDMSKMTFKELIYAIRENKVLYTAEFHPSEGKYFLTGHRGGIRGHKDDEYCIYSPDKAPEDMICPICQLSINPGVLQRAIELSVAQGSEREYGKMYGPKRNFYRMVPLVEIIAKGLGIKSPKSKRVVKLYELIVKSLGNECKLWTTKTTDLEKILSQLVDKKISDAIIGVREGNFCFDPPGFDGTYGDLSVGKASAYKGIEIIHYSEGRKKNPQTKLDSFMTK